jgi:hypothetical protein
MHRACFLGEMSEFRHRLAARPEAEPISAVHAVPNAEPLPATQGCRPTLVVEAQNAWNNRHDARLIRPSSTGSLTKSPVGSG